MNRQPPQGGVTRSEFVVADAKLSKQDKINILNRSNLGLSCQELMALSPFNVVSDKVKEWFDYNGLKAYQATADNQPAFIDKIPLLLSEITLPDVALGVAGKGFTCTGLAYDATEGIFYVGNIGKDLPATAGFYSTIVKLSKDGATNLGEINIYETFPAMEDIQGLTIDTSDDSLWFCSKGEDKIRHITKAGVDISNFGFSNPTGIAYDSRTDTLWILDTTSSLVNVSKTGTVIKTISVAISDQDQIYLDEVNNVIYFTAGANYTGINYVYKVDLATETVSVAYNLKDSYAVEGIYIEGDRMYILNDGYYHTGTIAVNQMNIYDISTLLNGILFDGTDNGLTVDASAAINNLQQISVVAVIHLHSVGAGYGRIFDKINGTDGFNFSVVINNGLSCVVYHADGTKTHKSPSNSITYGRPLHIVLTHDKSSISNAPIMYINGSSKTIETTGSATGDFTADTAANLTIGNNATLDRALDGLVLEFYVFDKILTQSEIDALFAIAQTDYNIS